MEIKTHLESHGIRTGCYVCGQGYELIPSETVPYTHEAYRHGEHLGVICCDCFTAGEAWLRTMLELPSHEAITDVMRPRYLDISTGQFEPPADTCETCGGPISDDEADVCVHLGTTREGFRVLTLSHRTCRPDLLIPVDTRDGKARLCILEMP